APRRGGAAACGRASPAQGVACQAERGGRRPEALAAAARVSGARREPARCAAQQSGPEGVTPCVASGFSTISEHKLERSPASSSKGAAQPPRWLLLVFVA
ncbi:hypothetical protein ACHZIA_004484, partial [Yersinia enterocolitica]|nr:hypothetical protein [Salmonella enterica]HBY4345723.1 hypothetical protein [Klebsiella pneumoniae]